MKKEKTKFAEKGDKITQESCPNCHETLVVKMDDGAEVFECDNCKFKITKKK